MDIGPNLQWFGTSFLSDDFGVVVKFYYLVLGVVVHTGY